MDLSKTFGTINHNFLLEKLHLYDCFINILNFTCSYLKNRKQRVQINITSSARKTVIAGVLPGPIDGFLLFYLFINDLVPL